MPACRCRLTMPRLRYFRSGWKSVRRGIGRANLHIVRDGDVLNRAGLLLDGHELADQLRRSLELLCRSIASLRMETAESAGQCHQGTVCMVL